MDERYHEELNKAASTLCEFCDNDDCRSCRVALLMDYADGLYQHDLKNRCEEVSNNAGKQESQGSNRIHV